MLNNKTRENIRFLLPRIVCIIITALYMLYIFSNSMDSAEQSSQKSSVVTETVQTVVDIVSPGSVVREDVIRKLAHFTEFMLFGALTMVCIRIYTKRYIRHVFISLFVSLAAGVADELIQLSSSGRASEVTDIVIDFSGAAAGIALCILCIIICDIILDKRRRLREMNGE